VGSALAAGALREWRSEWRRQVCRGAGEEEHVRGATGRHRAADDGVRATRGGRTLPRAPRRHAHARRREEADTGAGRAGFASRPGSEAAAQKVRKNFFFL
jgi:hypothetical protein